jgi:cell division septation protein DedD
MGLWDWLEQQYPAPGSRAERNDFPPLSASAALLRLIEQGVAAGARDEDDDASAAQAARETGAAAVARAVKPPYGRDKGWLTQAPEDWLRSISPLLKRESPVWPSPSNPVSPMRAPVSPTPLGQSLATDAPRESQAGQDTAAAATLAGAARHPYGGVFRPIASPSATAKTENTRQVQAAYEASARRIRNAAKPEGGRKEGEVTQGIVDHWPEALLFAAAPGGTSAFRAALGIYGLLNQLRSARPAE